MIAGLPVQESSWLKPGHALVVNPGALALSPAADGGRMRLYVNPSDMVVLRFGHRPFYSRYTLGAREADRYRRRR